jgi:PKD repeat protein
VILGSSVLAGFVASKTEICEGDTVQFTNTCSNATSYLWTFNGGTPYQSTDVNPIVIYNTIGNFDVELQATGVINSVTLNEPEEIKVNALPLADFTVNDTLLYLPGALALFQNNSTNASSYIWNFGDGLISIDNNPWHIYDTLGFFTVTLIAQNAICADDTLVQESLIHVDLTSNTQNIIVDEIKLSATNPFNNELNLNIAVDKSNEVNIQILDAEGKEIKKQVVKSLSAGNHQIVINTANLSQGIYILNVSNSKINKTLKVIKN